MAAQPNYDQIYNTYLQQQTAQQEAAAKPVVDSLEAQRNPLTQRYKNLIDQLSGRETQDIETISRDTNREFGARGILPGSGLFAQTLGERTKPVRQYYTGQIGQVGADQENAFAQLNSQIAGAKSGFSQRALDYALDLAKNRYSQEYNAYQDETNRAAQIAEAEKQRQFDAQQNAQYKPRGGGGGTNNSAAANAFKAKFGQIISTGTIQQQETALYNFLRNTANGGQGGGEYATSIGLNAETYWQKWRDLDKAVKTAKTKTKTSAADAYFKKRLGG